jgi:membrane-anchored glycerophosphoryl diester phosphodiesterase (GDPDase)
MENAGNLSAVMASLTLVLASFAILQVIMDVRRIALLNVIMILSVTMMKCVMGKNFATLPLILVLTGMCLQREQNVERVREKYVWVEDARRVFAETLL